METWTKNLIVIILVFKVFQRAGSHTALSHPPASSFLCVVCSLHSVCCLSPPHCSTGASQKPAGWSTLLQLRVTLVSTRIRQNSLEEAQWLLFSSQAYRTCQGIQFISCFITTEWNTNARAYLLIVLIDKICRTWHRHLPFSFPCCLFAVCIPWSRKIVQYILRYWSSPKCSIRQKLRTGMKVWQSKLWNHHFWSQTLRQRCTCCPWTWAAHHAGSSGSSEGFLVKLTGTWCKEDAALNGNTNHWLTSSSYQV